MPSGISRKDLFRPELLPNFPSEFANDPAQQVASRMYADEVAFYRRMGDVVSSTLDKLVWEFEQGLTLPSTSAAQSKAIGDMIDRMARYRDRMADLTSPEPSQAAESLLAKLNALTRELQTMQRARKRAARKAVEVEAIIDTVTTTPCVSEPDKTDVAPKSLGDNET